MEAGFSLPMPLAPFLGWMKPLAQLDTVQDSAQTCPLWRVTDLPLLQPTAPVSCQATQNPTTALTVLICLGNPSLSPGGPFGIMSIFVSLQHLGDCPVQAVQKDTKSVLGAPLNCTSCPKAPSSPIQLSNVPTPSQNLEIIPKTLSALITFRRDVCKFSMTSSHLPSLALSQGLLLSRTLPTP